MATFNLIAPARNTTNIYSVSKDISMFNFSFDPNTTHIERIDNNLVFTFADENAAIILQDYYTVFSQDFLPNFTIDNEFVSGEDFFETQSAALRPEETTLPSEPENASPTEDFLPEEIPSNPNSDDFEEEAQNSDEQPPQAPSAENEEEEEEEATIYESTQTSSETEEVLELETSFLIPRSNKNPEEQNPDEEEIELLTDFANPFRGLDESQIANFKNFTDALEAFEGSDTTLVGTDGDDFMFALGGDDILIGGLGNDTMFGGGGNDTFFGGLGDDIMFGGEDKDIYKWTEQDLGGNDIVMDFNIGEDYLDLSELSKNDYTIKTENLQGDTIVTIANNAGETVQTITLADVELDSDNDTNAFILM